MLHEIKKEEGPERIIPHKRTPDPKHPTEWSADLVGLGIINPTGLRGKIVSVSGLSYTVRYENGMRDINYDEAMLRDTVQAPPTIEGSLPL